jgi:hypothetical protein
MQQVPSREQSGLGRGNIIRPVLCDTQVSHLPIAPPLPVPNSRGWGLVRPNGRHEPGQKGEGLGEGDGGAEGGDGPIRLALSRRIR